MGGASGEAERRPAGLRGGVQHTWSTTGGSGPQTATDVIYCETQLRAGNTMIMLTQHFHCIRLITPDQRIDQCEK